MNGIVHAIGTARAILQSIDTLKWAFLIWALLALFYPARSFENTYVILVLLPFVLLVDRQDLAFLANSWVVRLAAVYVASLFATILVNDPASAASTLRLGKNLLLNFSFLLVTTHLVVSVDRRGSSLLLWLGTFVTAIGIISIQRYYAGFTTDGRFSIGEWVNVNTGSAIAGLIAAGLLAGLTAQSGSRGRKLFGAIISGFLIVLVVATGSRAPLAGVLASIVAVTIAGISRRALLRAVAVIALIAAAAIALEAMNVLVVRGSDGGRLDTWSHYAGLFSERMLRGYGINNEWRYRFGATVDNPHNMLLAALLYGGITSGLTLAALLLTSVLVATKAASSRGWSVPLALVAYFVTHGMFEAVLPSQTAFWTWLYLWLPIAFATAAELQKKAS